MSSAARGLRLGLRREVALVLPLVLLLLVVLSTWSVLAYRSGLQRLAEDERERSRRLGTALAEGIAASRIQTAAELRERLPGSRRLAVLEIDGGVVRDWGTVPAGDPLPGFGRETVRRPVVRGPDTNELAIEVLAPTLFEGRRRYLYFEEPAAELARQLRSARLLLALVLPINLALSVLVLLFRRHILAPYDALLARARRVDTTTEEGDDEVSYLIASFERALGALDRDLPEGGALETLQTTLGPNLESGMLLLGRGGEVLALNEFGARILECDVPEPETGLAALLAGHPELLTMLRSAVEAGEVLQRKKLFIERAQDRIELGLSLHPLRRDDGRVRGFLVLFADLTETRREDERERLSASLAQVGELAAGVAHEMRNSLSTFRGYLTLIDRAPDEESIADYLSEIHRETEHLERVLEDFLSFARPGSTRVESLNLNTVLRRASIDPALSAGAVTLESDSPMTVRGDAQLLERAFRNLLKNADQAQRAAGAEQPVRVVAAAEGGAARIDILDRGGGIPEAIRDRLFEPFVTGRADGVGLGLSLARRILDLHGGTLELEPRDGGGTRAIVTLPLTD